MKFTDQLYAAAQPVWEACIRHPFVKGIGDGTLPLEKFQHYMLQDYLYLLDYAKVFALGVVKAREPELMGAFAKNVEGILHGEMNLHRAYMKRLGIEERRVNEVRPALENLSYTRYMLSVAHDGGPMEVTAAILACSWSYAVIGRALAAVPGAQEHPFYGEWVATYSSEQYEAENRILIDRMDALAKNADAAQRAYLTDVVVNCSRYELDFWNMAWEMRA